MSQNLQQKYEQLQRVCRKQEAEISRLQNEIRERCQSYLLHTSRFKKQEVNPSELNKLNNLQSEFKSDRSRRNESETCKSAVSSDTDKSETPIEPKPQKIINLTLTKEIDLFIEPYKEDTLAKIAEIASLTESYKSRIAVLQTNKNQYVKELEKVNGENKDLKAKNNSIQREFEVLAKSEKKLKDKLKRVPDYELKIDEIYIRLMKEVKKEEFSLESNEEQKHVNQKIEEIIDWILQSKQKVDKVLEDFNKSQVFEKQKSLEQEKQISQEDRPSEKIEEPQPFLSSPMKTQEKIGETWTIISKLNEVDIKPFETSQIKPYHLVDSISNNKCEEDSLIKNLEENSLMYEEQLNQSKKEITELRSQLIRKREEYIQIQSELQKNCLASSRVQENYDSKINSLQLQLESSRRKNDQFSEELQNYTQQINRYKEESRQLSQKLQTSTLQIKRIKDELSKHDSINPQLTAVQEQLKNEKTKCSIIKQELQRSRIKISELQESKIGKQLQNLSDSLQKEKLNTTQADANISKSKLSLVQQLEAPYFVEQQLQNDSNDEYVKRSFIRKKIVKRNLSATTYRIVSKSKEEVQEIMSKKLNQYRDKSKEKAAKLKASEKLTKEAKLQALQNSVNRVSEVSEPRDSDINRDEQVRIIEVTTITPNQQIKSAKIYTKGGEQNLSTRRKY